MRATDKLSPHSNPKSRGKISFWRVSRAFVLESARSFFYPRSVTATYICILMAGKNVKTDSRTMNSPWHHATINDKKEKSKRKRFCKPRLARGIYLYRVQHLTRERLKIYRVVDRCARNRIREKYGWVRNCYNRDSFYDNNCNNNYVCSLTHKRLYSNLKKYLYSLSVSRLWNKEICRLQQLRQKFRRHIRIRDDSVEGPAKIVT